MEKEPGEKLAPTDVADWFAARLKLTADEMPKPGAWSQSGNTIGALALRMNVLTLDQVEAIIDLQATERDLFGELAVRLGFLSPRQVENLLELQRFQRSLELGERLVMEGHVDLATCVEILADYLGSRRDRDAADAP